MRYNFRPCEKSHDYDLGLRMSDKPRSPRFVFPRWTNLITPLSVVALLGGAPYMLVLIGFGLNPTTLNVGYQPRQPVAYSHELHVNQLGLDCRYCHNTVERTSFAAIPALATCMNCHTTIRQGSRGEASRLEIDKLRSHYFAVGDDGKPNPQAGTPVEWIKVHDLPDFAYFNHSIHVNAGVSCVSCHDRIDHEGREGVHLGEPLSMGWCLKCHREPQKNLRPLNQVTNLAWGLDMTPSQITQVQKLGETSDDATIKQAIAQIKPGTALTDDQRLAIGKVLADHRQVRNRHQLSDCYLCHR